MNWEYAQYALSAFLLVLFVGGLVWYIFVGMDPYRCPDCGTMRPKNGRIVFDVQRVAHCPICSYTSYITDGALVKEKQRRLRRDTP